MPRREWGGAYAPINLALAPSSTHAAQLLPGTFVRPSHLADQGKFDEAEALYTQAWHSGHSEVASKSALVVAHFAAQRHDSLLARKAADWAVQHGLARFDRGRRFSGDTSKRYRERGARRPARRSR